MQLHGYGSRYDLRRTYHDGVAGRGRGIENAEHMAEFLNRTGPNRVVNFSMFLHEDSPLYQSIKTGEYQPADEVENLKEERRLLELLIQITWNTTDSTIISKNGSAGNCRKIK